jgi:hypothetical protein
MRIIMALCWIDAILVYQTQGLDIALLKIDEE